MSTPIATLLLPGYLLADYNANQSDLRSTVQPDVSQTARPKVLVSSQPDVSGARFHFQHDAAQLPWQAQLCQLLGWSTQRGERLPSPLEQGGEQTQAHADPIHLMADLDTATLIPPTGLALSEADADALLRTLNEFVENDGLHFYRDGPDKWFISGLSTHDLIAYPTSFLGHRKASAFLSKGEGVGPWQRLMTEIQMLLHTHPVNQQRELQGLMTINSVWFWGGAPLPDLPGQDAGVCVYADDSFATKLCAQLQTPFASLTDLDFSNGQCPSANKPLSHLIIADTRIMDALSGASNSEFDNLLGQAHDQYLLPLATLVSRGQLAEFRLMTEDGLLGTCQRSVKWWQRLLGQHL